jgi:hypothetical protein
MTFLVHLIKPLSPIYFPVRAHFTMVRASLWTTNSDRVVTTLDHLVIAFLYPPGPVVLPVKAPIHSCSLGKPEERKHHDPREN